jgi:hypothetical protein
MTETIYNGGKDMQIFFPAVNKELDRIDPEFINEWEGASLSFPCALFWYGNGELLLSKVSSLSKKRTGVGILRSWMMRPKEYKGLYEAFRNKETILLTKPEEYETLHFFPNIYPYLQQDTAKSYFFPSVSESDVKALSTFESGRFMVKDYVKSAKTTDFPKSFPTSLTEEEFRDILTLFQEKRGAKFTGGFCVKEFLPLKRYGESVNEFRVFYLEGVPLTIQRNSGQPFFTKDVPMEMVLKYANLPSPFYTVDFAETDEGFVVIEAGDGQVSGLSERQDIREFFHKMSVVLQDRERAHDPEEERDE